MAANYDNAAWFYDRLSRLVYGRQLINAHRFLLSYIPANSKILIAGGGTGYVLEELTKLFPSGLHITYVELSANMIALSKQRNAGNNEVNFINAAIEDVPQQQQYDVVFTPFLLDNFTQQHLQQVFIHLHRFLKPSGLWLCSDFQLTGRWWQVILLKLMFVFFRLLDCVQVNRLPDIDSIFEQYAYKPVAQKTFFGDFIKSTVYQST